MLGAIGTVDDRLRWLLLAGRQVGAPAALVVGLLSTALLAGQRRHIKEPGAAVVPSAPRRPLGVRPGTRDQHGGG